MTHLHTYTTESTLMTDAATYLLTADPSDTIPSDTILKIKYDSIIEGYPDRASSIDDYSDIKPKILGRYLSAGEKYVYEAKNVLSNSSNGTTNGESGYYSKVMRSMNVIGKLDVELIEMLNGFFTGTITDMYDTLELKVVKGLLKFWDCLKLFVLKYQCDDCTLDTDSLKEASYQELEDCMNDIMKDLHCLLLKARIIEIDTSTRSVIRRAKLEDRDTFKFLHLRVEDKLGPMDGMASGGGLQKKLLDIAIEVLKLFSETGSTSFRVYDILYGYDLDMEEFVVDSEKFKAWVKPFIDVISVEMNGKTVSYLKSNMDAIRNSIFSVTLGHMNFDLFNNEVGDAYDEFVTIDECDNNSQESIHTQLTDSLKKCLEYTVCVTDIHQKNSLKDMNEIKYTVKGIKWTVSDVTDEWLASVSTDTGKDKTVTIDKIGSAFNKHLVQTKQVSIDVISYFVDQIDELYDIPVNSNSTTTTTTNTHAVISDSDSNMNLALTGVIALVAGGLVFLVYSTYNTQNTHMDTQNTHMDTQNTHMDTQNTHMDTQN